MRRSYPLSRGWLRIKIYVNNQNFFVLVLLCIFNKFCGIMCSWRIFQRVVCQLFVVYKTTGMHRIVYGYIYFVVKSRNLNYVQFQMTLQIGNKGYINSIRVITKIPDSEQSYKGKVKTHNYINRQNQSTISQYERNRTTSGKGKDTYFKELISELSAQLQTL